MQKRDIPYKLISSYFQNIASDTEKQSLRNWLEKDAKNMEIFSNMKIRWKAISKENIFPSDIDSQHLWNRIQNRTEEISSITRRPVYKMLHFYQYVSVALLFIIISIVSIIVFPPSLPNPHKMVVQTQNGQKVMILLPDSTNVWLNSNTSIVYSSDFDDAHRSITLNGEAYFDVRHKSNHPFVVHTKAVDIVEIGTAFNVHAYDDKPSVTVSLERGKLSVHSVCDKSALGILDPNESLVIQKKNMKCHKYIADAKTIGLWHLNMLHINHFRPYKMWESIASWYGVHIKVSNVREDKTYYFTVKTQSLRELLNDINLITPIEYKIDGDEVMIRYK